MYRISCDTNLNIARTLSMSPLMFFTISDTLFVIAGHVASRRGWQRFQYQRDTSSQLPTVDTSNDWATDPKGGMSGSGNACGTFLAVHFRSVLPSGRVSSSERVTVPSTGLRNLTLTIGLSFGWTISRDELTIGRIASNSAPNAKASFILGLSIRSRVTTRRISPTSIPGTAHDIFLSSGSYILAETEELSVASLSVLRKSTVRTVPFVPIISIFTISASPYLRETPIVTVRRDRRPFSVKASIFSSFSTVYVPSAAYSTRVRSSITTVSASG